MNELALLNAYLLVGAALVSIGLVGFLCRRNMIVMFLSIEMVLQGVSVSLVAWGRFHDNWDGQILTIFILTVAACEAAIALALVTMLYRRKGSLDIAAWHELREANQAPFVDEQLRDEPAGEPQWPHLTPAGVEPVQVEEDLYHRSHA